MNRRDLRLNLGYGLMAISIVLGFIGFINWMNNIGVLVPAGKGLICVLIGIVIYLFLQALGSMLRAVVEYTFERKK